MEQPAKLTPEEVVEFMGEYSAFVKSRFKPMETPVHTLLHAAVGMSGETGEFLDAVKKVWVYRKKPDIDNIVEELGDILFYFTAACQLIRVNPLQVMAVNVQKLQKRYPDGYTDEAAQARADKQDETPA
jgi:NTP pyrophosphatase (non-canonical NTP hydrolase)